MYQIHWKSLLTGATGHGTGLFPKEQADEIVANLNRDNKGILTHWAEEVLDFECDCMYSDGRHDPLCNVNRAEVGT